MASTGTWKGPSGYGGAFGYQEDASGLHLLGHRYYDSTTGRFLTRDPIRDGRNWYSYCENDPVNSADASGLVKIYIHYRVATNIAGFKGYHFWIVIEDNVSGSPTYGQRWYISGYPENKDAPYGKLLGGVRRGGQNRKAYDENFSTKRGYVLVDDQSAVGPWIRKAEKAANSYSGTTGYGPVMFGENSNTFAYYILQELGLLDAFDHARKKKSGPWSQPWGPHFRPPSGREPRLPQNPLRTPPAIPGGKWNPPGGRID